MKQFFLLILWIIIYICIIIDYINFAGLVFAKYPILIENKILHYLFVWFFEEFIKYSLIFLFLFMFRRKSIILAYLFSVLTFSFLESYVLTNSPNAFLISFFARSFIHWFLTWFILFFDRNNFYFKNLIIFYFLSSIFHFLWDLRCYYSDYMFFWFFWIIYLLFIYITYATIFFKINN